MFYWTASTSNPGCFSPTFTRRLHHWGFLEREWQHALVVSMFLLNFATCRQCEDTRAAGKCIFCFMVRSERGWRWASEPGENSFNPWTFHGSRAALCVDVFRNYENLWDLGLRIKNLFRQLLQCKLRKVKVKPVFDSSQIFKHLNHNWQGRKSRSQIATSLPQPHPFCSVWLVQFQRPEILAHHSREKWDSALAHLSNPLPLSSHHGPYMAA